MQLQRSWSSSFRLLHQPYLSLLAYRSIIFPVVFSLLHFVPALCIPRPILIASTSKQVLSLPIAVFTTTHASMKGFLKKAKAEIDGLRDTRSSTSHTSSPQPPYQRQFRPQQGCLPGELNLRSYRRHCRRPARLQHAIRGSLLYRHGSGPTISHPGAYRP